MSLELVIAATALLSSSLTVAAALGDPELMALFAFAGIVVVLVGLAILSVEGQRTRNAVSKAND